MKYCSKCHVDVMGNLKNCPLCQHELRAKNQEIEDIYPKELDTHSDNHMLLKVLGFVAIIICVLSLFMNIVFPFETWWVMIVIVCMGFTWLSVAVAIKKHRNILKYLWNQILILALVTILIDIITGYNGWALGIVIPLMLTAGMIVMYVLSKLLRLEVGDYMIYLLLDALFGIIPFLYLLISKHVMTDIPSSICILTSIISVSGLMIFEGRNIMSELKRRLHV